MKRIIKAIISFLCLFMLIGAVAQAEQNTQKTTELLENLNIITSGDRTAEGITTRAEFLSYAVRLTGNNLTYSSDKPIFTDVAKSHWAYNDICAAYSIGLVAPDGNGRLNPDSPITPAAASRIMLNTVGYGIYIKNKNDSEIITIAADKEILDNISDWGDRPLTKQEVFTILYNTLHVEFVYISEMSESKPEYSVMPGKTLLTDRFDVEYVEGIVTADERIAISGQRAQENCIIINENSYDITGVSTQENYVGSNVRCYWRDTNGFSEAVCIYEDDNVYAEFDFNDAEYKNHQFSQIINSKYKLRKTNAKTTVIINGTIIKDDSAVSDSIENYSGKIKMIDNNDDGIYDIVIIDRYINAIVEAYDFVNNVLKIKGKKDPYELETYENVYVENTYREVMSKYNFTVDSLVSVFEPVEGKKTLVIVNSNVQEGTIIGIDSDDGKTIVSCDDESKYVVSKPYLFNASELSLGEAYTLFIDFNGYLAYADKAGVSSELGYMVHSWLSEAEEDMMFKIFTSSGVMQELKASKHFSLRGSDGITTPYKTSREILAKLKEENALSSIPVMYISNANNEIVKLYLATQDQSKEFHILTDDKVTITNDRYEYRNFMFSGKYVCTKDTLFMTVPLSDGGLGDYRITSSGAFYSGSSYRFGTSYLKRTSAINIAVEPDGFLTDFFVFKVDRDEEKIIRGSTVPSLVKKVSKVLSDDEVVMQLTVMNHDGKEYSYIVKDCGTELTDNKDRKINMGDIVRVDADEYGEVSKMTIDTLYDSVNDVHVRYIGDDVNRILTIRIIPASVVARQLDYMQYDSYSGIDPSTNSYASREICNIASARVYVLNREKKTIETADINRISKGDTFVMYNYYGTARMIVYYE